MLPIEPAASTVDGPSTASPTEIVRPGQSIAAALGRARSGADVLVEPGEYRERVILDRSIRLVSRVPRGATIRLPAGAGMEPAVDARATGEAELVGFRIVGDAEAPLGVGVLVAGSSLTLVDVEVTGATTAAVAFTGGSRATLVGSDIHDNPGAALAIEAGASPRILHNVFKGNGLSAQTPAAFAIGRGAAPLFDGNVFVGLRPGAFGHLDEPARLRLHADNWFLSAGSSGPGGRAATRAVPGAR
jgi:hypothetical protein